MKTATLKRFTNVLGITTESVDDEKGLLELSYLNGLLVAVSDDSEAQLKASNKLREVSHTSQTMVLSCEPLDQAGGSTIVPGVDCRVPVFTVYSGRFEDQFPTNGHKITNNRLLVLMQELEALNSGNTRAKTPYLSWMVKGMGTTRPKTLEALQQLIIDAAADPESVKVPAIQQLLVGRGTRHAVLTVSPDVQYRDTEPTVAESDWKLMDLERLVMGGITETQASVLRKTSQAFTQAIQQQPKRVAPVAAKDDKQRAIQMLVA